MAKSRKSSRRKRRSSRAEYWRRIIEEWTGSGLTQSEFCRQRELSLPSFSWWKWELARRERESEQPMFLPVRVVGSADGIEPALWRDSGDFEVTLQQGYRIRVPEYFDPEALRRLIKALEVSTC